MQDTILFPSAPKILEEHNNEAKIEISGLHPGYGMTIGNALRRVLLSSLPGAAVTSVKIEGAHHEFSTLPGVLEDILSILLNIKQLRFRVHSHEPRAITLSQKGEREITGSDIEAHSDIEIVNKDLHLATLTDKSASLSMELTVERGVGYMTKESMKREKNEVGMIALDAVFTPVRKVSFEVENMRVGTATNYNRLKMLIQTDGTITPRDAFLKGLSILQEQLRRLERFNDGDELPFETVNDPASSFAVDSLDLEKGGETEEVSKIRIEDLKLSSRTINTLTKSNIRTVGNLVKKSSEDLMKIDGVGEKAIQEIEKALTNLGVSLSE